VPGLGRHQQRARGARILDDVIDDMPEEMWASELPGPPPRIGA
jgi:hypothetical protein